MDYVLACIDAGNLHNAIAHAATVVVGIKPEDKEQLSVVLNTFIADVKNEYKRTEPKMEITCKSVDTPETIIDTDTARRVVNAVYAAPHGISSMSMEIPGLVETSTNLASVKMRNGNQIVVEMFHRSSIESGKYDLTHRCETVFRLAGADEIISEGGYQAGSLSPTATCSPLPRTRGRSSSVFVPRFALSTPVWSAVCSSRPVPTWR